MTEQRERVARSEESRRQEQARAEQELTDSKEKHQAEAASLQEKIIQLVRRLNRKSHMQEMIYAILPELGFLRQVCSVNNGQLCFM